MKRSMNDKRNDIVVIIIPITQIRDYITIDFIFSSVTYVLIKKLTMLNWAAFAGSFLAPLALRKLVNSYRMYREAHRQIVMPVASISRASRDALPPSSE